jgi:hypothetical protein
MLERLQAQDFGPRISAIQICPDVANTEKYIF